MHVRAVKSVAFPMIDILVELQQKKAYPFNRPDAIIPQKIIPAELRADKYKLACFYFYVCIYMRGGIESLQAFNALIKMWRAHPELFEPYLAQFAPQQNVQAVLKKFIGWDAKNASINWIENSKRLVRNWKGNPLNLLKGLRTWELAVKRIRNKTTKKDQRKAGERNEGFRGFQYKMVSMLLYFYDWEKWFEVRFLYPSPADFHNFRLALANGALVVTIPKDRIVRTSEKLSKPWRDMVMAYLRERNADPVVVADALWLFSLVLCGNSPFTVTRELKPRTTSVKNKEGRVTHKVPYIGLFEHSRVEEEWTSVQLGARKTKQLKQTCVVCPLAATCSFAIPSKPYYRKGRLILHARPHIEHQLDARLLQPPAPKEVIISPEVKELLPLAA